MKTKNSSILDSGFEGFTVPLAHDFINSDEEETMLYLVRVIKCYPRMTNAVLSSLQEPLHFCRTDEEENQ